MWSATAYWRTQLAKDWAKHSLACHWSCQRRPKYTGSYLAIQCRHVHFPDVSALVWTCPQCRHKTAKASMQKKYAVRKNCRKVQIWPDVGQSSHREMDYTADQNKELDWSHLHESPLVTHPPRCGCVNERVRGQLYIQELTREPRPLAFHILKLCICSLRKTWHFIIHQ